MKRSDIVPFFNTLRPLLEENNWENIFDHGRKGFDSCYVEETKDVFLATFDMPGVCAKDIHIEHEGNVLAIYAERRTSRNGRETVTSYNQRLALALNLDKEKIQAHYEDGVLEVMIPKIAKTKKQSVCVGTGAKPEGWFQEMRKLGKKGTN